MQKVECIQRCHPSGVKRLNLMHEKIFMAFKKLQLNLLLPISWCPTLVVRAGTCGVFVFDIR